MQPNQTIPRLWVCTRLCVSNFRSFFYSKAESMATLETIAAAIKEIDVKKENLKKAYDDLQSHSSLLSSFSLNWSDLDAHFTHIQNSLSRRFRLLESLESSQSQTARSWLDSSTLSPSVPAQETSSSDPPILEPVGSVPARSESDILCQSASLAGQEPSSSSNPPSLVSALTEFKNLSTQSQSVPVQDPSSSKQPSENRVDALLIHPESDSSIQLQPQANPSFSLNPSSQDRGVSVEARPELRTLCEKMDGKGLRKYINQHTKDRESIRVELPTAILASPDPGLMILDALEGFYGTDNYSKGDKDPELCGIRRTSVFLLEVLLGINVNIGSEVRERAKGLAFEWKKKVRLDEESSLEALGFLHLVAAYGLGCEFQKSDLVEYFVIIAKYRQSSLLCKTIELGDKVQDLIRKLIDNGKQLLAVKHIFEFELIEKYPPVPLLKTYLNESKQMAVKICKDGRNSLRSQNEATAKELSALKAVIKVIKEHKLESEYPKEILEKRIEQLEKQKADRKRPAAAPAAKPQQQQRTLQQIRNKRPRINAHVDHAPPSVTGANSTVPTFQQPHVQPAGLLPNNSAVYLNAAAGPYGLLGSSAAVASYAGPSVGLFGLTGAPVGLPGNSNHATSHLYTSGSQMPSGYYDRSTAYGAYGVPPHYHPSYYPQ